MFSGRLFPSFPPRMAAIDFRWCFWAEGDATVVYFTGGSGLKGCVIHAAPLSYNHFCVSNVPILADLMELASVALFSVATGIFYIYQRYLKAHRISIMAATAAFLCREKGAFFHKGLSNWWLQRGASIAPARSMYLLGLGPCYLQDTQDGHRGYPISFSQMPASI